jgi:hypothetical protein
VRFAARNHGPVTSPWTMTTGPELSGDYCVTSATQPSESSSLTQPQPIVPPTTSYKSHKMIQCPTHWWKPAERSPNCLCQTASPSEYAVIGE